ncbi:MAG: cytochrome c oxidase assembly protein [Chloroflexi bacterium]|nr:cytochrome c oxidase assembly protein [Chloroflexota bacterium]
MTPGTWEWDLLRTAWTWAWDLLAGFVFVSLAYFVGWRTLRPRGASAASINRWQPLWFYMGLGAAFIALVSPLDALSSYLLSAHMVQHLLLTLVLPPLLLIGTPGWMLRRYVRLPVVRQAGGWLTKPLPALVIFNTVFLVWHMPALYDLALNVSFVHIIEHLTFIITGIITWWPVLSPLSDWPKLSYPKQVFYLFLESVAPTGLGAILTFANGPIYSFYQNPALPRFLGMSPLTDQQTAGLIMWVPGTGIYLLVLTVVFFIWFSREGVEESVTY